MWSRCYRPGVRLPSLRRVVPSRVLDAVTVRVVHPLLHTAATAAVGLARETLRWAYVGAPDGVRMGFRSFGPRSMVQQPYATLVGREHVEIGSDTLLAAGVSLAAVPEAPVGPDGGPLIRIGDRVWSAPGLSIVAHRSIEVGDDVWFGPRVYVTDAGHDPSDPSIPIGHRMEPAEPVRIGAGSWLGAGVVVLPGVTIGEHVTVGAGSVVCDDLPAYSVAVGAPARVVRSSTTARARPSTRAGRRRSSRSAPAGPEAPSGRA
jgi:acetyltransferase-like isoleucine patch superfamily enzyme